MVLSFRGMFSLLEVFGKADILNGPIWQENPLGRL
jgi:hypothetical protein